MEIAMLGENIFWWCETITQNTQSSFALTSSAAESAVSTVKHLCSFSISDGLMSRRPKYLKIESVCQIAHTLMVLHNDMLPCSSGQMVRLNLLGKTTPKVRCTSFWTLMTIKSLDWPPTGRAKRCKLIFLATIEYFIPLWQDLSLF